MKRFLNEHPGTQLIIIDTLKMVREGKDDSYSYAKDYDDIEKLKKFADSHRICLLIVHHTRKQNSDDKFEMISGTNGLLGCADGAMILHKKDRYDINATLEVIGRDIAGQKLYLIHEQDHLTWQVEREDKSLIGTVKETVMQVSSSKKWISKPSLDKNGNPMLTAKGKPILRKSYSVLQDDFFNAMRAAGYTDVERGERGSTEEHLTVTQFKVQQETARLEALEAQTEKKEQQLQKIEQKTKVKKAQAVTFDEIDSIGRKTFTGKLELTAQECERLKDLAKRGIAATAALSDLKKKLETARNDARIWKERYEKLFEQTKVFIEAMKKAPEKIKAFLAQILRSEPEKTAPKKDIESHIAK